MTSAQVRDAVRTTPGDPQAARRALRAERAQLAHWRRLLRARLDLAVGALAPPEPLGTIGWDLVPGAEGLLPCVRDLAGAVEVPQPADVVELMTRLRRLDKVLARYGETLDEALEGATDDIVLELAAFRGDDPPTDPDGR